MSNSTPIRTQRTAYLASSPIIGMSSIHEWRDDPKEVNSMLAICEIITALPPEWFTHEERVATLLMVKELYGDPRKFLMDLIDGNVSYVNKCSTEQCHGQSLTDIIHDAHKEYLLQFGVE